VTSGAVTAAWVDADVTVVMFGLIALAALAPARRLTRVP
jgi:hypothetical protein